MKRIPGYVKYGISYKEYRKAYMRWRLAIKRGHEVSLDLFIQNKRVQIHKGKKRSYFHQRRALEVALATPKWVNIHEMATIYENRPEGYQVDHIIPIKGENVCGLHVPWNLQYLPIKENFKKGNKS